MPSDWRRPTSAPGSAPGSDHVAQPLAAAEPGESRDLDELRVDAPERADRG